jgi:hypothetical protein
MAASRAVRAAIGTIVIETTWIDYATARLVKLAGMADNEMKLLESRPALVSRARQAAEKLEEPGVSERTRAWLREAEDIRRQRDEVVHSIVVDEHRAGWTAYHPRSGTKLALRTRLPFPAA